ncbi:adenosine deaminase [soil metagenome]
MTSQWDGGAGGGVLIPGADPGCRSRVGGLVDCAAVADSKDVAPTLERFIAELPKVELHVHLVGSASVSTVLELARRHPDGGVPTDEQALVDFYAFTDFAHFIEVYIAVNSLVRTAEDVEAMAVGVLGDIAEQNVRYVELTVTPDAHLLMGIEPDGVAEAFVRARAAARERCGLEVGWVIDIPGENGVASGERTVEWVEHWAPEGCVGFGIGGPEIGVPRPPFADIFARARALGLASVPHAGETTGPQTIRDAIELLGAQRIGHGIAAAQDPTLMAELVERGIPLEVCPTSNIRTRAVPSLAEHPWPTLVDAGVTVTLNSDDPGMFDTTLLDEYRVAHEVFGVSAAGLADLARTAVRVSYAPDAVKARTLAEIDAFVAGHPLTAR